LELEEAIKVSDDDVILVLNLTSEPRGKVTWNDPVVTVPIAGTVTWSGHIIRPLDCLIFTPTVELQYLGEMTELDQMELALAYMSLQQMEWVLVGTRVGRGIKNTHELKELYY
jgi:hypothetical protein